MARCEGFVLTLYRASVVLSFPSDKYRATLLRIPVTPPPSFHLRSELEAHQFFSFFFSMRPNLGKVASPSTTPRASSPILARVLQNGTVFLFGASLARGVLSPSRSVAFRFRARDLPLYTLDLIPSRFSITRWRWRVEIEREGTIEIRSTRPRARSGGAPFTKSDDFRKKDEKVVREESRIRARISHVSTYADLYVSNLRRALKV